MDSTDSSKAPEMAPARAPYKKRTGLERELDAQFFLKWHVRKFSCEQIAILWMEAHPGFKISHQTVFNSLKAQTDDWKTANQAFINELLIKSLHALDEVERSAWEGYERSCTEGERTITTRALPSLKGPKSRGEDGDDAFAEDERKLKRLKALIDSLCDDDGLPPITRQLTTTQTNPGDSSFLRVIAQCQKIRVDILNAITPESTMPDILVKFAKAIGVKVGP